MANRYFISGGTGNYNSTTNWSDTSGGAGGFSVPTASDDVYLDAASGANTLTINVSSQAKSFTCTGFVGTLAGGSALTVSGNITLGAGMTITWTGNLVTAANTSMTSNGVALLGVLIGGTGVVHTLVDDWTVVNVLTGGGSSQFNGNNLYISGSLSIGANNNVSGTTIFNLIGTGTWSTLQAINGNFFCSVVINTSGTITLGSSFNLRFGGSLTYIAGTVVTTGNTLSYNATSNQTFDTQGIVFNNFVFNVAITLTLNSDLDIGGNFSIGTAGSTQTINGLFNINISGNLTVSGTTNIITGTSSVVLIGTGVWSSTQSSTGNFRLNVTFNTAGVITISGNINYRTGTITYTAGTIITTGSTLNLRANTTLNTAGMIWGDVATNFAAMTITINSILELSGTWLLGAFDLILNGSSGFVCDTLSLTSNLTVARSLTLVAGVSYIINNQFTITGATNAFRYIIQSSVSGSQTILTLIQGANQNIAYVNATDIDSSRGQTIYSFNAVLSNATNWNTLNYPRQHNYIFQH